MKTIRNLMMLIAITGVLLSGAAAAAMASPAQEQLKGNVDRILSILRDPALKGESQKENRRQALRDAIYERFSFEKMSQFSLGRHWRQINADQKDQFVKLFSQLLEDTYVSKIESYTNEKVVYTGENVSEKKAKIFSEIHTTDVKIPIEYRMFNSGDGNWMVYDMLIEGVSLIKNYRTQFDEILQKDKFETLLEELKKKINS